MNALVQRQDRANLEPTNFADLIRFSEHLADSSIVPKDFQGKPGNVLVAIQWGRELNLSPLQALQSIAVINGRPAIWGDAMLAMVRAHPEFWSIAEGTEGEGDAMFGWCEVQRRGRAGVEMVRTEFSMADAKRAGLLNKDGPWKTYPQRMCKLRARGFTLRDIFADALRGMLTAEEVRDTPHETRDVPNMAEARGTETGPVRAAPGSMLEHAATVTGREVERPAEIAPAPEEVLPLVYLDGEIRGIGPGKKTGAPAIVVWRQAALREIAKAESAEALRGWRLDNGPNFGSLAGEFLAEVRDVEAAIEARFNAWRDEAAAAEVAPA